MKKKGTGAPSPAADPRQYLASDGDDLGFQFIPANEEQLLKATEMLKKEKEFRGGRKDVDKKVEDMTEDERAVFEVLDVDHHVDDG